MPRSIVLAFDGSSGARTAIAEAGRLFRGRAATVLVVWQSVEAIAPAATVGIPAGVVAKAAQELDKSAGAEADRLAREGAELARAAGLEAEARSVPSQGNVWVTIGRSARELDAAAVVVGSRGRSGIRSVLLGSTSSGLVNHSDRPTVVVRTPEPESTTRGAA